MKPLKSDGSLRSVAFIENDCTVRRKEFAFYKSIVNEKRNSRSLIYITDPELGESLENSLSDFSKLSSADNSLEKFLNKPNKLIFNNSDILVLDFEGLSFKVIPIIWALSNKNFDCYVENLSNIVPSTIIRRFLLSESVNIPFFFYTSMYINLANNLAVLSMMDKFYTGNWDSNIDCIVYSMFNEPKVYYFDGERFQLASKSIDKTTMDQANLDRNFIRDPSIESIDLRAKYEEILEIQRRLATQQIKQEELFNRVSKSMEDINTLLRDDRPFSENSNSTKTEMFADEVLQKVEQMFRYSLKQIMLEYGEKYSDFVLPDPLIHKNRQTDNDFAHKGNRPLRNFFDGVPGGGNDD